MKPEIKKSKKKLTLEFINQAEKKYDLEIPIDYKNFLLEYNGGIPDPSCFKILDSDEFGYIEEFYSFGKDSLGVYYDERVPKEMYDFGYYAGNRFYIVLYGEDKGKIYFWGHEGEADDGEEPTYDNLELMANNFEEFINSFEYDPDELPFEKLCKKGKIDEIKYLIDRGLDVNTKDGYRCSILRISIEYKLPEITNLLLEKGADIGESLIIASSINNIEVMSLLLKYGADINYSFQNIGDTALRRSIYFGKVEAIKFLIDNGADINSRDSESKSILSYAKNELFGSKSKEVQNEIIKILEEAGANE